MQTYTAALSTIGAMGSDLRGEFPRNGRAQSISWPNPQKHLILVGVVAALVLGCETGYDRRPTATGSAGLTAENQRESVSQEPGQSATMQEPEATRFPGEVSAGRTIASSKPLGSGAAAFAEQTSDATEHGEISAGVFGSPPAGEGAAPGGSAAEGSQKASSGSAPYPVRPWPGLKTESAGADASSDRSLPAGGRPRRGAEQTPRPVGRSVSAGYPIQLSTGVALAQTLPTGTAMGFSVDYRWVGGQPAPGATYFWVIRAASGPTVRQPVQLQSQGTLQGFALDLRPEHGPFECHLEDYRGQALSPSIPLR